MRTQFDCVQSPSASIISIQGVFPALISDHPSKRVEDCPWFNTGGKIQVQEREPHSQRFRLLNFRFRSLNLWFRALKLCLIKFQLNLAPAAVKETSF